MIPNVEFFFGIFWVGTKNHGLAAIVLVVLFGGGGNKNLGITMSRRWSPFTFFFFCLGTCGKMMQVFLDMEGGR